jgi:uncharacterized protein DUF1553/uncharacterized protein DUF1549
MKPTSLLAALLFAVSPAAPGPAETHWAYRPPVRPAVPRVQRPELSRTPIDRYVLAALETKGLSLNPEADRPTLIRRVSFDLTGLPPTPAEIDAFLADTAPDAYERMVERYLASPHYGERWGKFWLDAAGYADSNGYFNADSDRPLAWHYRDYVVRSLNADKPYDHFVFEQLAGDELAGYEPNGDVTSAMVERLIATHFLRNAPDGTGESDGNPDEVRTDRLTVLEGNLQVIMNSLLGVSIQCARCHAHKFEPISHEEYYRLQAILSPVYSSERWIKPNDRVVSVASRKVREEHRRRTELIDRQVKALQSSLAAIAGPLREQLLDERRRSGKTAAVKVSDDELARRFPEYAAIREQVGKAIAARQKDRPAPLEKLAVIVETDPKPLPHHLLRRGRHNAPGPVVQPGVPAALTAPGNGYRLEPRPPGRTSSGRRSAFARWVTSAENPLFARVMVNRIWQHHFGVGLVTTPDNLGRSGARPSHPELLDWLAVEFVRSGWSVKAIHRLILGSAVYRQSSASRTKAATVDSGNRLLWRYPLRRLDAEAVRDAMLAVSGELDRRAGGPYTPTRRLADGTVAVEEKQPGARRRSLYLQQRRTQVATFLELFDAPAMALHCSARTTSTVPLQALTLLNSEFALARAEAFARRVRREAGTDPERRLALAFRLAVGHEPSAVERTAARRFLQAQREAYGRTKDTEERVWRDLCQMILASNAFL